MKPKLIGYWVITLILAFVMVSGGLGEVMHAWGTLETVTLLGYPVYFLTIIGVWKILGGLIILVPGFPRLKEWAYAGMFFNLTGAAASHAFVADYGAYAFHIVVPLVFALLVIASWALRPASRSLDSLFSAQLMTVPKVDYKSA